MKVTVVVSTPAGDIDLSVGPYELAGGTFESEAMSHRRTEVTNQFVEGTYVVNSLRENVVTPISFYVRSDTHAGMVDALHAATDAFSQSTFELTISRDSVTETWQCFSSDYTVATQREFQHALMARVDVQVVHTPATIVPRVSEGLSSHVVAADPHPQYVTDTVFDGHLAAANPHTQYAMDADLQAHENAADPHAQYVTDAVFNAFAADPDPNGLFARARGVGNLLSADMASMEGGSTGNWTPIASTCTVDVSSSYATHGSSSLRVTSTVDGLTRVFFYGPGNAPVVPGETYTAMWDVRQTTSNAYNQVSWYLGGSGRGAFSATPIDGAPAGWQRYRWTGTAPADCNNLGILIGQFDAVVGTTYFIDRVGVWRGTGGEWSLPGEQIVNWGVTESDADAKYAKKAGETFTGNVFIAGSPPDHARLYLQSDGTNQAMIVWRQAGYTRLLDYMDANGALRHNMYDAAGQSVGTYLSVQESGGAPYVTFPAGAWVQVVEALQVGVPTLYHDAPRLERTPDPATGDLGLPGHAGSDTGWREVTPRAQFTAAVPSVNTLRMRRSGDMVNLLFRGSTNGGSLVGTNNPFEVVDTPVGFQPSEYTPLGQVANPYSLRGTLNNYASRNYVMCSVLLNPVPWADGVISGSATWMTYDPWPTSLPGAQITPPAQWT